MKKSFNGAQEEGWEVKGAWGSRQASLENSWETLLGREGEREAAGQKGKQDRVIFSYSFWDSPDTVGHTGSS